MNFLSTLNRVLSVEISPALYWFATTDGEDKHWRSLFCQRFGLVGGIRHLVAACGGRTIAGGELRLTKVQQYADGIGLKREYVGEPAAPEQL